MYIYTCIYTRVDCLFRPPERKKTLAHHNAFQVTFPHLVSPEELLLLQKYFLRKHSQRDQQTFRHLDMFPIFCTSWKSEMLICKSCVLSVGICNGFVEIENKNECHRRTLLRNCRKKKWFQYGPKSTFFSQL